jgi:4-hydroxybenzoate polyprenyltransferase
LLVVVWLFLAAMSCEFGLRDWLKAHPLAYMISHMMIMPLIDGYATACDWLVAGSAPPHGIEPFLIVSFFNGVVLEIGRKVRAPDDEEPGVETYSALWDYRTAAGVWLLSLFTTAYFAWLSARAINVGTSVAAMLSVLLLIAGIVTLCFVREPHARRVKAIEAVSALWTLLMYLSLGAIPCLLRWYGSTA